MEQHKIKKGLRVNTPRGNGVIIGTHVSASESSLSPLSFPSYLVQLDNPCGHNGNNTHYKCITTGEKIPIPKIGNYYYYYAINSLKEISPQSHDLKIKIKPDSSLEETIELLEMMEEMGEELTGSIVAKEPEQQIITIRKEMSKSLYTDATTKRISPEQEKEEIDPSVFKRKIPVLNPYF